MTSTETSVCWEKLQKELRVNVVRFLSLKERCRIARSSKSVRDACTSATTIFHNIKAGILPIEYGRPFSLFLSILRYGVFDLGLGAGISQRAVQVLKGEQDTQKLHHPSLMEDLAMLNTGMYTYWDCDHSGEPDSGVYAYGKTMAKLNPSHEFCQMVVPAQHWAKHRITGHVFIVKERPDGTIIVSADMKSVYLVQGILCSVGGLLVRNQRRLPVNGIATFLPLHEYIAFDGLFMGNMAEVDVATRKKLFKVYAAAADNGTIITQLKVTKGGLSSSGAGATAPASPEPPIALTAAQQANLAKLQAMSKVDGPGANWVFRRHDYTEALNPEHLVTIMSGMGMPVLMGATTAKLQPTALELFEILCDAVLRGRGMMIAPGMCPYTVSTDELSIVKPLRALLEPTGIRVAYYPIPSQEEQMTSSVTGGCAVCHIPDTVLRNRGLPGLSACAQCKIVSYCSRECQKKHWKVHKLVCKKPDN